MLNSALAHRPAVDLALSDEDQTHPSGPHGLSRPGSHCHGWASDPTEVGEYAEAQRLAASNGLREQLLLGAAAVADERSTTYMLLLQPERRAGGQAALEASRRRVEPVQQALEARVRGTTATAPRRPQPRRSEPGLAGHAGPCGARPTRRSRRTGRGAPLRSALVSRGDAPHRRGARPCASASCSRSARRIRVILSESLVRYYAGPSERDHRAERGASHPGSCGPRGLGSWEIDAASRNAGRD
jgi:hypothetical protein